MYLLIPSGPSGITVGTTTITGGTSGAIPFNGAGVYQEDATQLFWDNTNNRLGIGINAALAASLSVKGSGATSATYAALFENSIGTDLFAVRDDGNIIAGTGNSLSIGQTVSFSSAIAGNVFIGANIGGSLSGGGLNTAVGRYASGSLTSGQENTSFGYAAGYTATDAVGCVSIGSNAGRLNLSGDYNISVGYGAAYNTTGNWNTIIGYNAGYTQGASDYNVFLGRESGYSNSTGNSNVFLGTQSGYYETGSSKLFIDNAPRTNEATARTNSLVYGVFNATVTSQELHFNAGLVDINGRLEQKQGTDVASAAGAIALGYDGNSFEITGTSAITLISNLGWQNGSEVTLLFTSTATIASGTATSGTDVTVLLDGGTTFAGVAGARLVLQISEIGGTQAWREITRSYPVEASINTTAGDSATINSRTGRFRKDTSGSQFTLTNSYITSNSIIMLTPASNFGGANTFNMVVTAGSGSATIDFYFEGVATAPVSNADVNFWVVN
jgi:hypothetical protein